ncbi:MAG: glycosyltransferase family 39 protein [Armatimonadetes bacterium]|nr:glycosyltransferase family 39 protein [Armatimonadota bacterium]
MNARSIKQSYDGQRDGAISRSNLQAVLVIALAGVLRLYHLGTESLWIDEGYSLRDASSHYSFTDVRPLYFRLLSSWMVFGKSEAWLRLPSAIFGILSVALLYILVNRLYGKKPAVLASLLLAVSPLHINHSQEVRMYALTTMLVIAEVLVFVRYFDQGKPADLIACLLVAGVAFLVFPLSIIMLLPFNILFLYQLRNARKSLAWYGSQAMLVLAGIPFLPAVLHSLHEFSEAWTWRLPKPGLADLLWATRDFYLWRIPVGHAVIALLTAVYAVFVFAVAIAGIVAYYRKARWQTIVVILWLVIPLVTTALVSNLLANIWLVRYVLYASPAYYILTALGLSAFRNIRIVALLLTGVISLPLVRLTSYYGQPHRPQWREAVAFIQSNLMPGDSIAIYRYGNRYVFDYYYSGDAPWVALGSKSLTKRDFQGWTEHRISQMMTEIPKNSQRIWFILSYHEDTGGFSIEEYIQRHYRILSTKRFERVSIHLVAPFTSVHSRGSRYGGG